MLLVGDYLIGTLLLEHFNSQISDRNVVSTEALGHLGRVYKSCGSCTHCSELRRLHRGKLRKREITE